MSLIQHQIFAVNYKDISYDLKASEYLYQVLGMVHIWHPIPSFAQDRGCPNIMTNLFKDMLLPPTIRTCKDQVSLLKNLFVPTNSKWLKFD